jgi:hypothetical protein
MFASPDLSLKPADRPLPFSLGHELEHQLFFRPKVSIERHSRDAGTFDNGIDADPMHTMT